MAKKGLIIKTILSVLIIPIILLVIYLENGAITWAEVAHWGIHLFACILVCETVHAWWHRKDHKVEETNKSN